LSLEVLDFPLVLFRRRPLKEQEVVAAHNEAARNQQACRNQHEQYRDVYHVPFHFDESSSTDFLPLFNETLSNLFRLFSLQIRPMRTKMRRITTRRPNPPLG